MTDCFKRCARRTPYRQRGFTLIEMLVALAIIALLAGIAYPSYQRYTQGALRTDAQAGLLGAAAELERCYARHYSYADCAINDTSPQGHYALTLVEQGSSFQLSASTSQNDGCPEALTLDALGQRRPEACW